METIDGKRKAAIYSLRAILWEILLGTLPFGDISDFNNMYSCVSTRTPQQHWEEQNKEDKSSSDNNNFNIFKSLPKDIQNLISDCWLIPPENRPTIKAFQERLSLIMLNCLENDIREDKDIEIKNLKLRENRTNRPLALQKNIDYIKRICEEPENIELRKQLALMGLLKPEKPTTFSKYPGSLLSPPTNNLNINPVPNNDASKTTSYSNST